MENNVGVVAAKDDSRIGRTEDGVVVHDSVGTVAKRHLGGGAAPRAAPVIISKIERGAVVTGDPPANPRAVLVVPFLDPSYVLQVQHVAEAAFATAEDVLRNSHQIGRCA